MSFICNECHGGPDFKTQYNKENHQGQCHIHVTECKDSYGTLHRIVRQSDELFYCPTCSIGCKISNFCRHHVTQCSKPAGSNLGMVIRMGGFATPEEAFSHRARTSASPSPGPSLAPPSSKPYSRPAKPVVSEEEKRKRKEDEEDRLERKREVALEFAKKQKAQKEEAKERVKEKARRLQSGEGCAVVAAAPLPSFKKRVV